MRHVNVISHTGKSILRGDVIRINIPYDHHYILQFQKDGFESALLRKTYVKILQYVYDHDGCTRKDILRGIGQLEGRKCNGRGQLSNIFSQLLYIDVLDYDKHYKYHLGKNGMKVLGQAYNNEMDRNLKGKM